MSPVSSGPPAVKTCVYTYLLGSYDRLLPQPVASDSDAEFICFTDDPSLTSDTWQIHLVEPRYPADPVRSARYLKIIGDPRLDDYDVTLCIDASVLLHTTPERLIADWLDDEHDVALARHSYREQVIDEFDEVIRLNYDDRVRVHEQLLDYARTDEDVLSAQPLWTGMIVRRRTPAVERTMRLWFDHVLRYSRRDQLSVRVAFSRGGVRVRELDLDNFESEYHRWPFLEGRRIAQGKSTPYRSGPLIAELRRAQRRLSTFDAELAQLGIRDGAELIDAIEGLRSDAAAAQAERARLEARVGELTHDVVRWHERWLAAQGITGASANLARAIRSRFRRRPR